VVGYSRLVEQDELRTVAAFRERRKDILNLSSWSIMGALDQTKNRLTGSTHVLRMRFLRKSFVSRRGWRDKRVGI
jgi:hypothetical protein